MGSFVVIDNVFIVTRFAGFALLATRHKLHIVQRVTVRMSEGFINGVNQVCGDIHLPVLPVVAPWGAVDVYVQKTRAKFSRQV